MSHWGSVYGRDGLVLASGYWEMAVDTLEAVDLATEQSSQPSFLLARSRAHDYRYDCTLFACYDRPRPDQAAKQRKFERFAACVAVGMQGGVRRVVLISGETVLTSNGPFQGWSCDAWQVSLRWQMSSATERGTFYAYRQARLGELLDGTEFYEAWRDAYDPRDRWAEVSPQWQVALVAADYLAEADDPRAEEVRQLATGDWGF